MHRAAIAFAATVAGCAEPAIEIELKLPSSSSIPSSYDLKCVTAIDVVAHDRDNPETDIGAIFDAVNKTPPCVELDRPPENFTDIRNAMKGHFDIPLPLEGLGGIQIRGRTGSCSDRPPYHEAIFYGGAPYRDGESITVPLVANLSCNTRRDYEVRPVNLLDLTATKTCTQLNDGQLFAGNIRPTLLDPVMPPLGFEGGTSQLSPVNGTAILTTYVSLGTSSCTAFGFQNEQLIGLTCIAPGTPTVCGEVNEIELPAVSGGYFDASIDDALAEQYGVPMLVGVWETVPAKTPLTGATVTLSDPMHGEVQFLDIADTRFTVRQGPTGPSGLFAVYSDRLQEATITAPGHNTRKILVGGTPQLLGTSLVVLTRQ